jgi:CBS-domain-containing membrane protein
VTRHAVDIAIILEDALQREMTTIQQFMVHDAVCARLWEPISHLRQRMLANSFSFLPVEPHEGDSWKLVADVDVARFLRQAADWRERTRRLSLPLEQAAARNGVPLREPALTAKASDDARDIAGRMKQEPVLVFQDDARIHLLGIVTAFDLL